MASISTPTDAHFMTRLRELQIVIEIAETAGKMILDAHGRAKPVETKQSFADLVTETDKNVERFIFAKLRENFSEDQFIGEEGTSKIGSPELSTLTSERTWIVDPIDGTMNFVHSFPHVAVCIGLAIGGEPVSGVVYCPALDEIYCGSVGMGAYRNGHQLKVRPASNLREALICTEIGSDRSDQKRECLFENLQTISWQCHGIRCLGSAAMNFCSVASGQTNAFYEFGLHCWDICAPAAILLAAGGVVRSTNGKDKLDLMNRRVIGACSESIAQELGSALVDNLDLERDDVVKTGN